MARRRRRSRSRGQTRYKQGSPRIHVTALKHRRSGAAIEADTLAIADGAVASGRRPGMVRVIRSESQR